MNSFSNRNYYRDFELQRDQFLQNAQCERLARIATEANPNLSVVSIKRTRSFSNPFGQTVSMNWAFRSLIILLAIISLLVMGISPLFAQDLIDAGGSEPYDPALVSYRVGYYYQLQGDQERAVEIFNEVIDRLPNWDGGYAARGDSYAALGQFDLAVADYTVALDLTPGFVSVLYMRGRAYQSAGEAVLAIADFQNAISQMPDYPLPYWGLADVYYEQQNNALALGCYSQYLALVEETPDASVTTRVALLSATVAAGAAS